MTQQKNRVCLRHGQPADACQVCAVESQKHVYYQSRDDIARNFRPVDTSRPAAWQESYPENAGFYRPERRVAPADFPISVVEEICRRVVSADVRIKDAIKARSGEAAPNETVRHCLRAVEALRCAEESLELAEESLEGGAKK